MTTPTDPDRLPGPRGLVASVRLLRGLTSDPCPALDGAAARYGPTFSVGMGPARMVVVGGPDDLDDLLGRPTADFRWGHWANVLGFFVGDGSLLVSDGDEHRRRRAQVQPGFARRHLDQWVPMIVTETDRAIDDDILVRDGPFDLFPVERRLVLSVVVKALFGGGLEARVEEIGRLIEPVKEYLEQPGPRQIPHPFPVGRRARAAAGRDGIDAVVREEVARRRSRPAAESVDVLDTLLAAVDAGDLTDGEVLDQVRTLIGAGYDTTTSALAWTTLRAAGEPEVWARLRSEAEEVLTGDLGPSTVSRLTYADAVVRESLRLHPPGVFSPRQAVRDVRVGPHTVPKGSMILWSPYLAGRDPEVWSDPLTFRPERHLGTETPPSAWVPFGRGPRRCIGFALAQMELTLAIARLAQRVDLSVVDPGVPRPYGMVVNRPFGGVRVTARRAEPTRMRVG